MAIMDGSCSDVISFLAALLGTLGRRTMQTNGSLLCFMWQIGWNRQCLFRLLCHLQELRSLIYFFLLILFYVQKTKRNKTQTVLFFVPFFIQLGKHNISISSWSLYYNEIKYKFHMCPPQIHFFILYSFTFRSIIRLWWWGILRQKKQNGCHVSHLRYSFHLSKNKRPNTSNIKPFAFFWLCSSYNVWFTSPTS